jgi:hypothetical protein
MGHMVWAVGLLKWHLHEHNEVSHDSLKFEKISLKLNISFEEFLPPDVPLYEGTQRVQIFRFVGRFEPRCTFFTFDL